MRSKTTGLVLVGAAAVCLLSASDARADSLSCKGQIVSTGDSTYQVRSVCGEPDATTRRVEVRTVRHMIPVACATQRRCWSVIERTIEVTVEQWTYDFGRQQFIQYLTFEDSQLLRIDSGSYGHKF